MRVVANRFKDPSGAGLDKHQACIGAEAPARVLELLNACPQYQATPLWKLDELATELGIAGIYFKDESYRLGLDSFKALGGIFAILSYMRQSYESETGKRPAAEEITGEAFRVFARDRTFVCASDGNHGRSVAAGSKLLGARCVVFLHDGVSEARVDWIRKLGAETIRTRGSYDRSVEEAEAYAGGPGRVLISDTSTDPDDAIVADVMTGYTVIADEILGSLSSREDSITHVFVQAGVGGLAASIIGHMSSRLEEKPLFIVVEPEKANCLLQSAEKGEAFAIAEGDATVYSMLECQRPSQKAWEILKHSADYFMDIPDHLASSAMRKLARGTPAVVSGESGCAGLAGLLGILENTGWCREMNLEQQARVLLIGTEGATDPYLYQELVNKAPGSG